MGTVHSRVDQGTTGASADVNQMLAARVRKLERNAFNLAMLYRTGLMTADEMVWLFRHLTATLSTANLHTVERRPGAFGGVRNGGDDSFESLNEADKDYLKNKWVIHDLLTEVSYDLQKRLQDGDPVVKFAFDAVSAGGGGWSGRSYSEREREKVKSFLENFRKPCAEWLLAPKK